MDALYFRLSIDRQTTENQYNDLLAAAERDISGRDWNRIRQLLSEVVHHCESSHHGQRARSVCGARPEIVAELATQRIYVEQRRLVKGTGRRRPLLEQMKRDATQHKFDRLLVWKVTGLGRDMREVIATVYELADLGVTVIPIKSQTGPISSNMCNLLWAIQAWFAEMENSERSETIRAGLARARAAGKRIGRPRAVFRRDLVVELRQGGSSWRQIADRMGAGVGTVRRAYQSALAELEPCQNYIAEASDERAHLTPIRELLATSAVKDSALAAECRSLPFSQSCRSMLSAAPIARAPKLRGSLKKHDLVMFDSPKGPKAPENALLTPKHTRGILRALAALLFPKPLKICNSAVVTQAWNQALLRLCQ